MTMILVEVGGFEAPAFGAEFAASAVNASLAAAVLVETPKAIQLANQGQAAYVARAPVADSGVWSREGVESEMHALERFEYTFVRASAVCAPILALLGLIAMAIGLWHLPPQGVKGFSPF